MAINDDETDDEADYLLIALARRIVSSGHSTRRVQSPHRFCRAVLLRELIFQDIFGVDMLYRNFFCNSFSLIVNEKIHKRTIFECQSLINSK